MATLRINCVDSMTIDPHGADTENQGEEILVYTGTSSVSVHGIRYYIGYHQSQYAMVGDPLFGNSGNLGDPGIFLFEESDLSVLDSAQIISAKLNLFPAAERDASRSPIYFAALPGRPVVRENGENISVYSLYIDSDYIAGYSVFSTYQPEIEIQTPITIDLSQNIDVIKKIASNGLMLYTGNLRITIFYNFQAIASFRPYIEIEYEVPDTSPRASPVSPVSTIVNGDQPVTFAWNYSQPNSMPQSHFQIQQYVGSAWQNIVGKTAGSQTSYTAPANTFAAGQGQWRVMVWCQNGAIASEWSDPAYIIVQIQPKAPTITSAGTTPSPTFTWQAAQQQGYEIKLGDYTTGTVYGTGKSWTYPGVLPDGNITFSIRTQSQQGAWSPWSSTETYISNTPSGTLPLSVQARNNAVTLTWAGSFSSYRVYRDGACIAQVAGLQFTDYLSAGKCTYQVYGMLQNGNYTPSLSITEIVRPKCAVISDVENISWIPLRLRSGSRPSRSDQITPQVSLVHYQGRSLPVPYMPGFMDVSYTFNFTLDRPETYQALQALAGKVVVLKHRRERFIGVLTGISTEKTRMADVSFSITETDYKEGPENA